MPRRKKKLSEMPDEQLIKKLFPKKVVDKMKEIAHEKDKINDEIEREYASY
jgi:hypothetical protein